MYTTIGLAILLGVAVLAFLLFKILRALRWLMFAQVPKEMLERIVNHHLHQGQARSYLAQLLKLPEAELPPMGGFSASADFLLLIAEHVLRTKPNVIVEFGAGISTLILARCVQLNGRGQLLSFEHDETFCEVVAERAARLSLRTELQVVPLSPANGYQGRWYVTPELPEIDVLIVDGPPMSVHPQTRGGAATLFPKLAPEGRVFLDDAARDGERAIATSWKEQHPSMSFSFIDTEKGTLIGRKTCRGAFHTART